MGKASTKRVTLENIGEKLGLDKSSVSLALRDSAKIPPATREKVKQIAAQMGYRMNLAARQLRTQQAQFLALILPESFLPLASHVTVASVQHLASIARRENLFFHILSDTDAIRLADPTKGGILSLDAALVWGEVPLRVVETLAKLNVPSVVIDPSHMSYKTYSGPCVTIDNSGGSKSMVDYLINEECENLLFVQVCPDHLGHRARWQAAQTQWKKNKTGDSMFFKRYDELTDDDFKKFVTKNRPAIFCSNDEGAKRVLYRLMAMGIKIPDDVTLAGFDADDFCVSLGLPSVAFDWQALAEVSCEELKNIIKNPKATHHIQKIVPTSVTCKKLGEAILQ